MDGGAHPPTRIARPAKRKPQELCGLSGTSLSLSAIRPSLGSEPAFIFCIALLRCTFTVASADADVVGNLFAQAATRFSFFRSVPYQGLRALTLLGPCATNVRAKPKFTGH